MTDYPIEFENDVVLRDGTTVHLRPVGPADAAGLAHLFAGMSDDTLNRRFFSVRRLDSTDSATMANVDHLDQFALVAELGEQILGFARFDRDPARPARAEIAVAIADRLQGHGIGTQLLDRLMAAARDRGISWFDAMVREDNQPMRHVLRDTGLRATETHSDGVVQVALDLTPTPEAQGLAAQRSRTAAAASMRRIFAPHSVAVVGASRRHDAIGTSILRNLKDFGFRGALYAVNPAAGEVESVPAFASVRDIAGPVDLAVVAVPAAAVEGVIDDCIAKQVSALVVITAGFAEVGAAGAAQQAALVERIRDAGIRMVGPNCMGILNTAEAVRLNATFAPVLPTAGRVGFATQSGALGLAILEHAKGIGLGLSTFVSLGNKADVSGNDLIQYWAEDPQTDVLLLYLESFGNPRVFARLARQVSRRKPIIAVKAGRSAAGARAAASHTGALASGDAGVEGMLRQAGVLRVASVPEMFDTALLLSRQPPPRGNRVAILTNAGGPGILAADACEALGLELPPLGETTTNALRAFLPAAAGLNNPIDMLAAASPEHYGRAVELLLASDAVDSLMVIYIPPMVTDPEAVAAAVAAASRGTDKTVLGVFMSRGGAPPALQALPCYPFPEPAAAALAQAVRYGAWQRRPAASVPALPGADAPLVRRLVQTALAGGPGWMAPAAAVELLAAAGVPMVRSVAATGARAAAETATRLGFPVALKAAGPRILHKTEVGGVRLGLSSSAEVEAAYADMQRRLGADLEGVVVQQMAPRGVEVMLGAVRDPALGPLVGYGRGGVLAELEADVAFRVPPLDDADVSDMLDEVKGTALLRGFRGAPVLDDTSLRQAIHRVAWLIELAPEIQELDVNPLVIHAQGACAVDARVRLAPKPTARRSRRIAY